MRLKESRDYHLHLIITDEEGLIPVFGRGLDLKVISWRLSQPCVRVFEALVDKILGEASVGVMIREVGVISLHAAEAGSGS